MSQILADLVRAQRVRTNAEQLARYADPTPSPSEPSPGCLPGFRMVRNRRLPKPEFREVMRTVDPRREVFDKQHANMRLMLRAAGVESRTYAPDPTIKVQKPWSQEFKHNDELSLDATHEERVRRAEQLDNWVITQKAENQRLREEAFKRQADAFYEAMNPDI